MTNEAPAAPPAAPPGIPDDFEAINVVVPLAYPRRIDGKAYAAITLRHPTAGDMISVYTTEPDPARRNRAMLALLGNIPVTHIDRLHAFDYLELTKKIESFLFNGPKPAGQK